jgi:hypothetical protein
MNNYFCSLHDKKMKSTHTKEEGPALPFFHFGLFPGYEHPPVSINRDKSQGERQYVIAHRRVR